MSFLVSYVPQAKAFFMQMAPSMPPEAWWATGGVLAILALAATVDAFTELVPEPLIFLGLFAVTAIQGMLDSWEVAGEHLRAAVGVGLFIWALNYAWFRKFKYDALGMGDAKWTMLAVSCFGITSGAYAWGIGSVLATIYIGLFRVFKYRVTQVTFSPFLFVGLGFGLYIVRFQS